MMKEHRDDYYGECELGQRAGPARVTRCSSTMPSPFAQPARPGRPTCPPVLRKDLKEVNPESETEIKAYNKFAAEHEHIMAKSLFCAGTTWPGVFTAEDQRALDYLCSRADVDPHRVGCAGLSGGGLRTCLPRAASTTASAAPAASA